MNTKTPTVTVETSDLYFAGFLQAHGARLTRTHHNDRGRCFWTFQAPGTDAQEVYLEYLRGALVPGKRMAEALVDLKRMALAPARAG